MRISVKKILFGVVICALGTLGSVADANPDDMASQMHAHLVTATAARDAVIHGDLDAVHKAGAALAAVPMSDQMPEAWRPMLAETKDIAERLAVTKDLQTASGLVGEITLTCANCHTATGGGPKIEEVPQQKWDSTSQMPLHKWSADWMWIGLISGNEAAWKRGGQELVDAKLAPRFEDVEPSEGLMQLEQLVGIVGTMAAEQTLDEAERARLYGQFVGVCAQCHLKVKALGMKK